MDKVKSRALADTAAINAEFQSVIALVKKIDQGQRRPIENLKNEVESLKRVMIDAPHTEQCLEDMESAITPVLELLGERMKHLEINGGTVSGGVEIDMSEIAALEDKIKGQLNEVTARINGMTVFKGGRWFWSQMECVDFAEKHISVGQFQWFLDIVSYIQLFTGETASAADSHRDEVHVAKVRKTKEKSIFIPAFKTDVPPILGGLGKGE